MQAFQALHARYRSSRARVGADSPKYIVRIKYARAVVAHSQKPHAGRPLHEAAPPKLPPGRQLTQELGQRVHERKFRGSTVTLIA